MGNEKRIYAICWVEKEREIMNYEMAIGINSKCKDGKHVLFIDVDYPHTWEKWVCLRTYEFMHDHNLGFALYSRTEHGFHVIILDKKDFREWVEIYPEWGDEKHLKYSVERGRFVLKIHPWKFNFITRPFSNELSYAHFLFFTQPCFCNHKFKRYIHFDGFKDVYLELFLKEKREDGVNDQKKRL